MFESERFQRNLAEASLFERAVVRWYITHGHTASLNKAVDYRGRASHDVVVDARLLECKMDYSSLWTGNCCVEIEALEHSHADYFLYGFPKVVQIPRSELLNMSRQMEHRTIQADKELEVITPSLQTFFSNPYLINLN